MSAVSPSRTRHGGRALRRPRARPRSRHARGPTARSTAPGPDPHGCTPDPRAHRPPATPPRTPPAKARRTRAHRTSSADRSNRAPRTRPPGRARHPVREAPDRRSPVERSRVRAPPSDAGPARPAHRTGARRASAPAVGPVSSTMRPTAGGAPTGSRGVPGRPRAFARGREEPPPRRRRPDAGVGSGGGSQTSSPTGTGSGAGSRDSAGGVRTRSARRSDHWPLFSPRANSPSLRPWISDVPAGA